MTLEEEFEVTLREINKRAGIEEHMGSRRFARELTMIGGVETAVKLLRPVVGNKAQRGFEDLVAKGRPELTLESVVLEPRFQELFDAPLLDEARRRLQREENPAIQRITTVIEERTQGRPFGELQELRKRIKGLKRLPSKTIFHRDTIHDRYAFHYGGRTELQFNIGYISLENSNEYLRHGLAISLQRSHSFHEIDDVMLTRIARFNEYIETYPDYFAEFVMYHNSHEPGGWSGIYEVRIISDKIVRLGEFIFLGNVQPRNAVDIDRIVDDFDRLLPLYEYVEGRQAFPAAPILKFERPPGLTKKPSRTMMTTAARRLDKVLRHNDIQFALGRRLQEKYGDCVWDEYPTGNGTNVDLALILNDRTVYYEIKTNSSARGCIREALGQILEYAYWPGAKSPDQLVIVGETKPDQAASTYLEVLRNEFSLPITYRRFDMKKRTLV